MSRANSLDHLLQLSLVESYCLPSLCMPMAFCICPSNKRMNLMFAWNNVFRTIFFFSKWESVASFTSGLGRLNFVALIKLARFKYFFHLMQINRSLLYDIIFVYYRERLDFDACLKLIFCSRSQAIRCVYSQFSADLM
jgi:hypothetical protein